MKVNGEVDKIRFLGWPKGQKVEPHPGTDVHTIEISDERSKSNFITVFTKKPLDKPRLDNLKDILPDPEHHDPEVFHLEGDENRPISERDFHYHFLYEKPVSKEDILSLIDRLEKAKIMIVEDIKNELLEYCECS